MSDMELTGFGSLCRSPVWCPQYMEANPQSLLVKIVGLYRLRLSPTKPPVHFLVMTNVLRTDQPVWMTYDLKVSRRAALPH